MEYLYRNISFSCKTNSAFIIVWLNAGECIKSFFGQETSLVLFGNVKGAQRAGNFHTKLIWCVSFVFRAAKWVKYRIKGIIPARVNAGSFRRLNMFISYRITHFLVIRVLSKSHHRELSSFALP